jgi:hypothetical protein
MMIQDSRLHFAAQNSHLQAKEYLRKLSTICLCALKNIRQSRFRLNVL